MAKKLYSTSIGKVVIYNPANQDAVTDPLNNLEDVFFHSDLDYVSVAAEMNFSITHAQRAVGSNATDYAYPKPEFPSGGINPLLHNLGYKPFGVCFINNAQLPANSHIQSNGMSFRTAALQVDETSVSIYETSWVYGSPLPAITINYRVLLFSNPIVESGTKILQIEPNRFVASRGKLDSNNRYLRQTLTQDPQNLYLSQGKTIDTNNGSFRVITADGVVIERPPYGGNFSAQPGIGVEL